ncbi:MAG: DinB family protein [Deltaproteobacteria bacterium]|nr:DinB family protein [Deltaproteobacteria bacterium]
MQSENKVVAFFLEELQAAHQTLEGTIIGVTQEQAHWHPPGIAHPVGATYAHVILSEDATINGMFKGQAPLFASGWAGKTGVSELPPMLNPQKPGFPDWREWGRRVRVDMEKLRPYAKAVYAVSEAYLLSLGDGDMNRPVDLSVLGLGQSSLRYVLINGILGNALTHCGEISCLKGLQSVRGYPF